MPIYEYRCDNCDHELEAMQKLSEDKLVDCPECGKDSLIKKISAAGFRLKGSGWYETDFKSGNKKNVSGSENSDNSGGSESSSNTSDSSSSSSSGETKSTSDASGSSNSSSSKSTSSKSTSSKSTSKD
ncbi:MAG: zinc ribbon domain-containing protein [Gammaproteobacteria bacterium]|nr:zinc ribbon domain-containing protein [Gammaproteobacteria bacterium]